MTADNRSPGQPPNGPLADTFYYRRRVEFADTDAAGIAHFTSLIRYAESAEHAFLRSIGSSVMRSANRVHWADANASARPRDGESAAALEAEVDWPRARLEVDFTAPAYFEDVIEIAVQVERLGRSSVKYRHTLRLAAADADGRPAAEWLPAESAGHSGQGAVLCTLRMVAICCRRGPDSRLRSTPLPDFYRQRLSNFLTGD